MDNRSTILLLGNSKTGKTSSLRNLPLEKVALISTDGQNILPFKGRKKIGKMIIPKDPLEVNPGVRHLEQDDSIEYIVIDTLSFWLDALEMKHVYTSDDSRGAWGQIYAAELKELIHFATHESTKNWIFISHIQEAEKAVNFVKHTKCYCKGATAKTGVEAAFSVVVYTHLYDKEDGHIGYGLQVNKTPDSIGLSVTTPLGMFEEPFLKDNDILQIFDAISKYDDE